MYSLQQHARHLSLALVAPRIVDYAKHFVLHLPGDEKVWRYCSQFRHLALRDAQVIRDINPDFSDDQVEAVRAVLSSLHIFTPPYHFLLKSIELAFLSGEGVLRSFVEKLVGPSSVVVCSAQSSSDDDVAN